MPKIVMSAKVLVRLDLQLLLENDLLVELRGQGRIRLQVVGAFLHLVLVLAACSSL